METTRKAWTRPQVFVLGADKTLATEKVGDFEGTTHIGGGGLYVHLTGADESKFVEAGSQYFNVGYAS